MYTEATAFCIDPGQQDKIRRRWIHSRVIDSRLLPLYTILCRRAAIMQLRIDQEKSNIFLICHLFLSSSSFFVAEIKGHTFFVRVPINLYFIMLNERNSYWIFLFILNSKEFHADLFNFSFE